jgi:hypothetical protein
MNQILQVGYYLVKIHKLLFVIHNADARAGAFETYIRKL